MPKFDILSANKFSECLATKTNENSNVIEVKMFKECESILVCSGDFKPEWDATINYFSNCNEEKNELSLCKPDHVLSNLKEALKFIFDHVKK